ncbi:MAG TPA: DUF2721 domain-containing protein [Burkholderiales bacterium]|nr:DUF2721 domain-containing protein [Burkholderiales bacterium]
MDAQIIDITEAIHLAVAPVFLLTAVATLITALNNRLGRIIDRRRVLQDRSPQSSDKAAETQVELQLLSRRVRLVYFSILSAVSGALMVCLVVAGTFLGALISVKLTKTVVAVFFIMAMLALIACLSLFLREVFIAVTEGTHRLR